MYYIIGLVQNQGTLDSVVISLPSHLAIPDLISDSLIGIFATRELFQGVYGLVVSVV